MQPTSFAHRLGLTYGPPRLATAPHCRPELRRGRQARHERAVLAPEEIRPGTEGPAPGLRARTDSHCRGSSARSLSRRAWQPASSNRGTANLVAMRKIAAAV